MTRSHRDKFRAARRLWARTMKEKFGAKDPRSMSLRFHVQTSGDSLTRQQRLNNIPRAAFQGLAAVLGGAQSMHICCFDEAHAVPTEMAHLVSLRTHQIILNETGVANTIDPLAGSYAIEKLTDQLEEAAQKIIAEVDRRGGERKARKWLIDQVRTAAYEYQKQVEEGKKIVVGVNAFEMAEEPPIPIPIREYDPSIRDKQIARLNEIRRKRDTQAVEKAKKTLFEVFRSKENVVPHLIEAAKTYITLGEIHQVRAAACGEESVYSRVHYSF